MTLFKVGEKLFACEPARHQGDSNHGNDEQDDQFCGKFHDSILA